MKRYDVFSQILGQQRVIEVLINAIGKSQVSHSYIFSGPKGTQRKKTAMAFAKILLAQGANNKEIIIHRVEQGNHPDLNEIYPDGASIKIHQIRSLIKDISIMPLEGRFKIYIIHDAHTMGEEAQNALLKTLEEPPEYGVIILLTNNLPNLLPTIISRSQTLKFKPLREEIIQNHLMENFQLDESAAGRIAMISRGSIERAVQLIKEEDVLKEREELLKGLLKIVKGDVITAFSLGKYLKENKDKLQDWLEFIMLWYRDVALYKELGDNRFILFKEYGDLLKEFSYYLSDQRIHDIIEVVNSSIHNMRGNINLQLNMETMLLKMQEE